METNKIQNDLSEIQGYINRVFSDCTAVINNPKALSLTLYNLSQAASDLIQLCGYVSGKITDNLNEKR